MREIVLETERKLQLIEVTDQIRDALGETNDGGFRRRVGGDPGQRRGRAATRQLDHLAVAVLAKMRKNRRTWR